MTDTVIHTLDARDNILLELLRDYFDLDAAALQRTVLEALAQTRAVLATKNIDYDALKNALVPHTKRREVALLFDSSKIDSWSYGDEVLRHVLPLLHPKSSHSVLLARL